MAYLPSVRTVNSITASAVLFHQDKRPSIYLLWLAPKQTLYNTVLSVEADASILSLWGLVVLSCTAVFCFYLQS